MFLGKRLGWGGWTLIAAGLALAAASCESNRDRWEEVGGTSPRIIATIPPLYCFARNVAGDGAAIISLCDVVGPHHYVYNPQHAALVRRADLFLANGLELDAFAERIMNNSGNTRLHSVEIGDKMLQGKNRGLIHKIHDDGHEEAGHDDHHHADHHHGTYDPHIWLGIPQAIGMVECIRDELNLVDPANKSAYDRSTVAYIETLKKLHQEGKAALAGKKNLKIVAFHDSLHYFAESFGLQIAGVLEARPGTESDPATLIRLIKLCQENQVRVIAIEPQYMQKSAAHTLRDELKRKGVKDVELVEVDPLETVTGDDHLDRGWYERKMRANIANLAKALR